MGPHPQTVTPAPARVFHYSLDWRFLLPAAEAQKTCLLFEENEDFRQTLEQVRLGAAQQLSFSGLSDRKDEGFQLLALPFGLPAGRAGRGSRDRIQFYVSLRRLIDSGGHLMVGFNNALNLRANSHGLYRASTPHSMTDELHQAGFKSVTIYGAMPSLQIPEYICDMDDRAIDFALRNRFRRKPAVLHALRLLSGTIGWKRISNFLPCYFAVAAA
jgi:hypothetical protein